MTDGITAVGAPLTRVDGKAKVTGTAKYAGDFSIPDLAHAYLVLSTIPQGRVTRMNASAAEASPGVLAVLTPFNAPRLPEGGKAGRSSSGRVLQLLQDDEVHYNKQPIGVVVAESLNQAIYASSLLDITYSQTKANLDFKAGFPAAHAGNGRYGKDESKGSVEDAIASAEVKIDQVYTTPVQNHNPLEPHATIAQWEGDKLTVHDSTQSVTGDKQSLANAFGVPSENVRVICPYTGGGFGCKGSTWSHVVLAAMAARAAHRPVKLALDRPQMFGPVGGRAQTHQHILLGATRDGSLVVIRHDVFSHTSTIEDFTEPSSVQTRMLYASSNISTSQRLVSLAVGTPTYQRAPGEATGTFALEIAMDELAHELNIDPIDLRMKNYAQSDPLNGKPFSSKNLDECYRQGAERFGWVKRKAKPRSMEEGYSLVGMGMATATYSANRSAAAASVTFNPDGRVKVACGSQELGTGTYTIMAQVASATLDFPVDRIDVILGDSMLPKAPVSGGSQSAASVTPAVLNACKQAMSQLFTASVADPGSPFYKSKEDELDFKGGNIVRKASAHTTEPFTALLARRGNQPIEATASAQPEKDFDKYSAHSWGAVFAEVGVDKKLGVVRVRRVVGVYDVGTLLNEKTGKSQLIGGVVWGVSLALHEQSRVDHRYGGVVNNNLAEYHVPVNMDIGDIDVSALNIPDKNFNALGARGIGEIGITGTAAAVGNAIYNATGKRMRTAPITPDLLME